MWLNWCRNSEYCISYLATSGNTYKIIEYPWVWVSYVLRHYIFFAPGLTKAVVLDQKLGSNTTLTTLWETWRPSWAATTCRPQVPLQHWLRVLMPAGWAMLSSVTVTVPNCHSQGVRQRLCRGQVFSKFLRISLWLNSADLGSRFSLRIWTVRRRRSLSQQSASGHGRMLSIHFIPPHFMVFMCKESYF